MRVLWENKRAMTLAEIRNALMQTKDWSKSTIHTLVLRLRDKGMIAPLDQYGPAQYNPLVTEEEFILSEEKALLKKFGSAKKLALAMIHNGHLTDADVEELRAYFRVN